MRYFVHPQPIAIKVSDEKSIESTFKGFVEQTVGADPKSAATVSTLRKVIRFVDTVAATSPGELVAVENDDWSTASAILENPTTPYITPAARQSIAFFDAILNATTEKPKEPPRAIEPQPHAD